MKPITRRMTDMTYDELAFGFCEISELAGAEVLAVYGSPIDVQTKADDSPVTEADQRAEAVILNGLAELCPDIPVVAEERVAAGQVPDISGGRFILVDPLDGTKEFISRNGEFTVNIALIVDGSPTIGVVYLPALETLYWTDGQGGACRRCAGGPVEAIRCRAAPPALTVVASRSHRDSATDDFLADYQVAELVSAGSSLKLCRVAEGSADMYPRLGRTMEWDIAAGHAVLRAAGGSVMTLDGQPLAYGKPGLDNPHFVARGLAS